MNDTPPLELRGVVRTFRSGGGTLAVLRGADLVLQAIGQLTDEFGRLRPFQGIPEFFLTHRRIDVTKIRFQCIVEEERILVDDAEQRAVGAQRQLPHVDTIQGDAAAFGIEKAHQQVSHGRFPGAAAAHQGHRLPEWHRETDFAENRFAVIPKGNPM